MSEACILSDRAILRVSGEDAADWLQSLISNDMEEVSESRSIYAALLSPQGKILFDFFVIDDDNDFLLDCEKDRRDDLIKRLRMYQLRSAVHVAADDDLQVVALFSENALEGAGLLQDSAGTTRPGFGGTVFVDPRCAALGARLIGRAAPLTDELEAEMISLAGEAHYHERRLMLGISNGSRDLAPDKAFVLESNLEELGGVSFSKGCFIGQEVTARTKHKSTLRKRILPVQLDGALPDPGSSIRAGDSEIGTLLSGQGTRALALIRLDRWQAALERGAEISSEGLPAIIQVPPWLSI